jgi:4-hydroxybenzoate polyprenyltransferase
VTWQVALRLGRVSNLPTVWTNVLAATVLAGAPLGAGVAGIALACSLFYVGGMFLNDAFDRQFDARTRPERPIPSGVVHAGEVFAYGFGLLAAGLALAATTAHLVIGNATPGVVSGGALAAAILLYDAWHKTNPAAPVVMGLCRVLVYLTASATLVGTVGPAVFGGAIVLLAYLIGLTYVARQERFGSVHNLWTLLCLFIPFVLWSLAMRDGIVGVAVYVGAVAWVLQCLSHLGWRSRVDIPRAVVGMIAGIALVDALAMASFHAPVLAVFAVACFALTLGLQRWVPGT